MKAKGQAKTGNGELTLVSLREEKGKSQVEAASEIGVGVVTLNQLERYASRRKGIQLETAMKVAAYYGREVGEIFPQFKNLGRMAA